MTNTKILDLMMLEIDIQQNYNKIKYARSLSKLEIKTYKQRLETAQAELKNLKNNAKSSQNTPL